MRDEITTAVKAAMKAGDKLKVETLRMVQSAMKNKDIEARGAGLTMSGDDELSLLQKLVKSRQESVEMYEKAGRDDLASKERAEIDIISHFLPKQMTDDDIAAAVATSVAETGATSVKDMGKVVGALKAKYAGRMDFAKASAAVKARLAAG